jgi:hypothetical protein
MPLMRVGGWGLDGGGRCTQTEPSCCSLHITLTTLSVAASTTRLMSRCRVRACEWMAQHKRGRSHVLDLAVQRLA